VAGIKILFLPQLPARIEIIAKALPTLRVPLISEWRHDSDYFGYWLGYRTKGAGQKGLGQTGLVLTIDTKPPEASLSNVLAVR
jgi:hypothetical protein